MKMAVGTVASLDEAIEHINRYGTGHSEAIVTERRGRGGPVLQRGRLRRGVRQRIHPLHGRWRVRHGRRDRQLHERLHARGPVGLEELTTTKYVVHGDGHIRE